MKNAKVAWKLLVFVLAVMLSLPMVGCQMTTPPANTTSTTTSSGSTTSGNVPATNSSTSVPSTTGTDGGLFGLDGEAAGNTDQAKKELQDKYGITAQDSGGETLDTLRIESGNANASIYGKLLQVLATLPESFRQCTSQVLFTSNMADNQGIVDGLFDPQTKKVYLSTSGTDFPGTTVHEMTHAFQDRYPNLEQQWAQQFWNGNAPKTSSVTDYGNTNAAEDMAESVRLYWQSGSSLKSSDPERYNFIKQFVMGGKEF